VGLLEGRVALVTGAAQGIGRAIAVRLAGEGARVAVTDRNGTVEELAGEIGAATFVGDVADVAHVRAVVDATVEQLGPITVLVNNAGEVIVGHALSGLDGADRDFDRILGSNTKGTFLFGRAVAPIMVEAGGGDIVNVSTDHVHPCPDCDPHHGHGGMDLYNASKWALNGLAFDWAATLARHGVRVNNLCMGATDTAMLRGFLGREPDPEYLATWMAPDDIARIVVDLIDEGPDGRTGDNIGLYAGYPTELLGPGEKPDRRRPDDSTTTGGAR
jgi:NAD(P)-dependent dehydrogenase (short-subunit alcohol dehydrogenase family)